MLRSFSAGATKAQIAASVGLAPTKTLESHAVLSQSEECSSAALSALRSCSGSERRFWSVAVFVRVVVEAMFVARRNAAGAPVVDRRHHACSVIQEVTLERG